MDKFKAWYKAQLAENKGRTIALTIFVLFAVVAFVGSFTGDTESVVSGARGYFNQG